MTNNKHAIPDARTAPFMLTSVLLLSVFPLPQALAQTPIETATTLDTVVVTANKRVENVQEVPKSVLVVTPEALSRYGATTIRELSNLIPSMTATTSERRLVPPIRGISSFSISIGVQSQTGVVIDDVPQPTYSSLFKELTDIEQLEVLAGPQSTLSGRNASGGLINIVTREPAEVFSSEISLEHTSDRQQRLSTWLTGPLSDTLAFSVSAFSNEWEGSLRSLTQTRGNRPLHLNGWDTQGARGKLRWQPNDRLDANLTMYFMESVQLPADGTMGGAYFSVDPSAVNSFDPFLRRSVEQIFPGIDVKRYNIWTGSPQHSVHKSRDRGTSLKMEYALDHAATLTSITSITRADIPREENLLYIPIAGTIIPETADPYAHTYYDTEQRVQEFRLTSPGGQRFDYLVGVVYSDIDTVRPYARFLGLAAIDENWGSRFAMKSGALFSRGTWNLGQHDALTAGLRYQRDKMEYSLAFFPINPTATIPDSEVSGDNHYDFLSGELSWRHTLAEDVNAYITVSRAQSGQVYDLEDWRGGLEENGLNPLDSQKVRNLELGLKGQWWQRRLTVNVNAFLAKYDNYHLESFREAADPQTPAIVKLYAIGKVQTRGIEFETRLRASERLNLNLAGTWLDATIQDYPDADCYTRQRVMAPEGCIVRPGFPNGVQPNLAGNRMPRTPRFKTAASASYFVPLAALPFDLELAGAWRWQSKIWFDFRGNPNLYQDSYGILNLSAALLERDGRYSLSIFVNNVLNKQFYLGTNDDPRWSAPAYFGIFARDSFRYAGVNLRVNF